METTSSTIWVGSELGYLKAVEVDTSVVRNYGEAGGENGRDDAPSVLCWKDSAEKGLLVGTCNGKVKLFSNETLNYESPVLECGQGSIKGLGVIEEKIISCTEKGYFFVWEDQEKTIEKRIGDDIRKMQQSKYKTNVIATGGKENNLKVFDINEIEKPIFMAKNVRNDSLDLRQPVWVTDIEFFDRDSCKIVVGTGYHSLKIYDTKAQRRPIASIDWDEYPITSLSTTDDGNNVIVGNTVGSMASIDLRKYQVIGGFKGIAGGITAIKCHHTQDFVASTGLDRFLRIYDIKSRKLLQKFYLKSRLTDVLLSQKSYVGGVFGNSLTDQQKFSISSSKEKEADDDDVDAADPLWSQMAVATDELPKKAKKKKMEKSLDNENAKRKKQKN